MTTIRVKLPNGAGTIPHNADDWRVIDHALVLYKGTQPVASYAAGQWTSVEHAEPSLTTYAPVERTKGDDARRLEREGDRALALLEAERARRLARDDHEQLGARTTHPAYGE